MLLAPLPDTARLWIFTGQAPLSAADQDHLRSHLDRFFARWASHGRPVTAAATVLHDRFLAVGALIDAGAPNAGVSGCGIDTLMHAVEEAGTAVGATWTDGLRVVFEGADGHIEVVPRSAFRALAREGVIDGTTAVFVTTLDTVGALRSEGLRRPAHASWHGRTFRLEPPQPTAA